MLQKRKKIIFSILVGIALYLSFSLIVGTVLIYRNPTHIDLWEIFRAYWPIKLLLILLVDYFAFFFHIKKLSFQDVQAGHGQHGSQSWASADEAEQQYKRIKFGAEKEPGFLIGLQSDGWLIDNSDANLLLVAPPGMGKTRRYFLPTLKYNALVNSNTHGHGPSLILMDIKGTLYNSGAPELQRHGYRTPVINLRDVFHSYKYNIMHKVNDEIDAWRMAATEEEKVIHYGAAERHAKIAAHAILKSTPGQAQNSENAFFVDTAQGMITGFILLVAMYAPPAARHIISVFELIIAFSSTDDTPQFAAGVQRTKLASLMEHIHDKRIRNYVAPASSADIRTSLNIFSSALADLLKFIDAEMEQLICDQSPELNAEAFVDHATAIFLICPDENETRHFLASLFVRSFTDELISLAETKYHEVLPRQFFYLMEEFGNMPAIESATAVFSAIRSRGGRVMCSLQTYDQLRLNYSENQASTIEKNCQILVNSALAPSADKDAKRISEMLGSETILTGSKSISRGVTTTTTSLLGRPLMSQAQLVTMPKGMFIVQKTGELPYKAQLKDYSEYLSLEAELLTPPPQSSHEAVLVATPLMIELAASGKGITLRKHMFDVGPEEW